MVLDLAQDFRQYQRRVCLQSFVNKDIVHCRAASVSREHGDGKLTSKALMAVKAGD